MSVACVSATEAEPAQRLAPEIVLGALGAWGVVLAVYAEFVPSSIAVSACALGAILAAVFTWPLARRWPLAGRWVGVLALLGQVVALGSWAGYAEPALLVVPPAVAAASIGAGAALAVALGETVLVAFAPQVVGVTRDPVAQFLVVGALSAALALVLVLLHRSQRLAEWTHRHVETSQRSVEEARARRAELEQMREDWHNATRQLASANQRLASLRQQADQARKAKAEFAAKVSHEFRTPLNIIVGMVDLLVNAPGLYEDELPAQANDHLAIVYRNCQHLAAMIDDVLDLSRVDAGQMALRRERVDLAEVVRSAVAVVEPLADRKSLQLVVQLEDDLPPLYCDRTRIRQVILNLLSNAARLTEAGEIRVAMERRGACALVTVADTGPGIEPGRAERIFEPFQRGMSVGWFESGGSGLGLSISKEFVELHGGRIWFESELGCGSTFYVELPAGNGEGGSAGHASPPGRWIRQDWVWRERSFRSEGAAPLGEPGGSRAVVLDENGGLRQELARDPANLQVLHVPDLSAACLALERGPADVVLVNAGSEDRLLPLVREARARVRGTPIVGSCYPRPIAHALAAGAVGYLTKPVGREAMLDALRAVDGQVSRVLILDDEADAREYLTYLVRACDPGIEVSALASGAEALAALMDAAPGAAPDLLLVDLLMPGMDGWAFLEAKARVARIAQIPAYIVSAQDAIEGTPYSPLVALTMDDGISSRQLVDGCRGLWDRLTGTG